jgi:hypothetical protein
MKTFSILPKPTVRMLESIESASLYKSPTMEDFNFLYDDKIFDLDKSKDSRLYGKKPLDIFLYKNISFRGGKDTVSLSGDYFMVMEHQYYSHYINDIVAPFLYVRNFVPSLKLLVVSNYHKEFDQKEYDFNDGIGNMMKNLMIISEKCNIDIKFVSPYSQLKIENLYYWDQELFLKKEKHSYTIQNDIYDVIFKLINKTFALKNNKTEKIYISRRHSNADSRNSISPRYIENEELIEEYFKSLGYSVHHLESYNLNEQIELFSKATKVVGFTGSGFTNVLWTDRDTPIDVIEISSWMEYTDNAWRRIAESLGHNFFFIGMSNTSNSEKIVENLKRFSNIFA